MEYILLARWKKNDSSIGQDIRMAVFRLLVQARPAGWAASKLAEGADIPLSSLTFHLKELTHAELLVPRQDGQCIICAANFNTMNALIGFLTSNCCDGNPCMPVCAADCAPGDAT
jgi:ArsR family transcriptional regulator